MVGNQTAVDAYQTGKLPFPDGTVLVNEINTMPGFTETSVYAKLLEADGLSYPDLCDRLVALAIERHERARSFEF